MKICILSNKGSVHNEGQRNTASSISKELMKDNEVLHLNAKETFKNINHWKMIKNFNPDVLHFFLRPSFTTFAVAKLFQIYLKNIPLFFSAIQPILPSSEKLESMLSLLRPTCVLTITEETEDYFKNLKINTALMKCGVDINRFHDILAEEKTALRRKYNLDSDKPIALHVGHLTKGRNLDALVNSSSIHMPYKLLIVASPLFKPDKELISLLKSKGAIIIHEYLQNIQEIYQIADIYLFPTLSSSYCIEAPLSVFEAMATNLPVITTRFGVLPKYFKEGGGLIFVDDPNEIFDITVQTLKSSINVSTREKVNKYTWQVASYEILHIYKDLIR